MEFIDWQPGNGTRYPIAFWQEEKDGHLRWVITWLRNEVSGPSFKWSGDLFDLDYMAGKMDINIYDAQGLATFLYTRGIEARLHHWQKWESFRKAEELGFDKLLLAS
jgi:hypothetical protein